MDDNLKNAPEPGVDKTKKPDEDEEDIEKIIDEEDG